MAHTRVFYWVKPTGQRKLNVMNRTIAFSDIKPIDRFESILKTLREKADITIARCHKEKTYNKALAIQIQFCCDTIFALENGLKNGKYTRKVWNEEYCFINLLYAHLLVIDLNQTAHTYLNPFIDKFESPAKQLQDFLDGKKEIYGNVTITE